MQRLKQTLKVIVQRYQIRKSGFWFVDIPRTSTTALKVELAEKYGAIHGKGPSRWHVPIHSTAAQLRGHLGQNIWGQIFTFTIVRNPFSRAVSFYRWATERGHFEMPFRGYVSELQRQFETGESEFSWHAPWYRCADYVLDEDGNMIVDHIVKYENRSNDLQLIAEKLAIPSLGQVAVNQNAPIDRHYMDFYNEETRAIVERLYAKDLELFEYEFESDEQVPQAS